MLCKEAANSNLIVFDMRQLGMNAPVQKLQHANHYTIAPCIILLNFQLAVITFSLLFMLYNVTWPLYLFRLC